MASENDTPNDSTDSPSRVTPTRRQVIAALFGGGAIAAGATATTVQTGSEPNAAIGGGPMADPAAELRAKLYEGTLAERPDAGISGRYYRVDDPGAPEHGEVYEDTGTQWNKIDLGVQSITTEEGVVETLEYDYSSRYPQSPRQPEQSGAFAIRPHPGAKNPVLTGDDHTGILSSAKYVADAFMVPENGAFHMFYELAHDEDGDGNTETFIVHAESDDGLNWSPSQVILDDTLTGAENISYPFPVQLDGEWYLLPNLQSTTDLKIFRATSFPKDWEHHTTHTSVNNGEPTPVNWNDKWFLFYGSSGLKYSDNLLKDDWQAHSDDGSMWSESRFANPAGRPIVRENGIDFFLKDSQQTYGHKLRVVRITELTTTSITYTELDSSPIAGGDGRNSKWNGKAMHAIDHVIPRGQGDTLYVVDGRKGGGSSWAIGIYTDAQLPLTGTQAHLGSDQSLKTASNVGWEQISVDTTEYDRNYDWDASNSKFVAPADGYYQFLGKLVMASPSGTPFRLSARLFNSGLRTPEFHTHVNVNEKVVLPIQAELYLAEGDTVALHARQNSGGSLNITGGETRLTVRRRDG